MVFGMSTACFFPRRSTEDAVVKIGQMGIRNIEVFLCCHTEYSFPFLKILKQRIEDQGLKVNSVHALSIQFEPQLFSVYPRAKQDAYDVLEKVLEAASYLDAKLYTFHGVPNLKQAKKPTINYKKIAENISKIAEKCEEYGVLLGWENVHWCLFSDTNFLNNLLLQELPDNLRFTLDIKQAAQAGIEPEAFIHMMGGKLANVHLCDYIIDPKRGIVPMLPFEGSLDFNFLKKALKDYNGPIIYEVYENNYKNEDDLELNYRKTAAFFENKVVLN